MTASAGNNHRKSKNLLKVRGGFVIEIREVEESGEIRRDTRDKYKGRAVVSGVDLLKNSRRLKLLGTTVAV